MSCDFQFRTSSKSKHSLNLHYVAETDETLPAVDKEDSDLEEEQSYIVPKKEPAEIPPFDDNQEMQMDCDDVNVNDVKYPELVSYADLGDLSVRETRDSAGVITVDLTSIGY